MFEDLAYLARVGGLFYFLAIFVGVLVYALRPANKRTFDHASRIPLQRDDEL